MKEIRLSEWIGEGFYDIHRDIREGRHTHYWLKGGRGSGKSSFLSLEILLGLIADRDANAVVLRKVAANLRDSVFEQMNWAIHALGVEEEWEKKISPMYLYYTSRNFYLGEEYYKRFFHKKGYSTRIMLKHWLNILLTTIHFYRSLKIEPAVRHMAVSAVWRGCCDGRRGRYGKTFNL